MQVRILEVERTRQGEGLCSCILLPSLMDGRKPLCQVSFLPGVPCCIEYWCSFRAFYFSIYFIYLKGREKESTLICQMDLGGADPRRQEFTSPWVVWTQVLEPSPAAPTVHMNRKLELGLELGLKPRYSSMHCNHCTRCLPQNTFNFVSINSYFLIVSTGAYLMGLFYRRKKI